MLLLPLLLACEPAQDDSSPPDDTNDTGETGDSGGGVTGDMFVGTGFDFGDVEDVHVFVGLAEGVDVGSATLSMTIATTGPDVDLSFDPCFMPTFELWDEGGALVWTGSDPYAGACKEGVEVRTVAAEAPITSGFSVDGVPAGAYTLRGTQRMRAAGHDDPVASTGDFFDWTVEGTVGIGDTLGLDARAQGVLPLGVEIRATSGPLSADPDTSRELYAAATPSTELLGTWEDCGWPRFRIYDGRSSEPISVSPADMADCSQVVGWPAGEERSGSWTLEGDGEGSDVPYQVYSSWTRREDDGVERSFWAVTTWRSR